MQHDNKHLYWRQMMSAAIWELMSIDEWVWSLTPVVPNLGVSMSKTLNLKLFLISSDKLSEQNRKALSNPAS